MTIGRAVPAKVRLDAALAAMAQTRMLAVRTPVVGGTWSMPND
jgi:hypothetical protein